MDNAKEKQSLGSRIVAERTKRGITQRQLALMTGTSRSYLWKIEIGAADVGIDVLVRIARALDVPVATLSSSRLATPLGHLVYAASSSLRISSISNSLL